MVQVDSIEESNRMWASVSFVGVLIIIGLPLWWKTTEVYRVALPYDKINELPTLPLLIATELTILANDEPTANEVADILELLYKKKDLLDIKVKKSVLTEEIQRRITVAADEKDAVKATSLDLDRPNHIYVVQRKTLLDDVWLGTERIVFFKDVTVMSTLAYILLKWTYQLGVLGGAPAYREADDARRVRVPPAPHYHVTLSVVHPRPDLMRVDFDAAATIEDYVGAFVDELSVLHNFTLKSQWLHFLEFNFQAKETKDSDGRHFAVREDRLPLLLTRLEERAATHVSAHPTINLALYVQPCQTAPLVIYDKNEKAVSAATGAFMSPKWGGVVLGNPGVKECVTSQGDDLPTYSPNVRLVMGMFLAHLRELLGIVEPESIEYASLEPLRSVQPRKWEVDALLRMRTIEQITAAQLTLRSLAQLLGEISNIVINDEVGASIFMAVEGIEVARRLASEGLLQEAYNASQSAMVAAEAAFLDPSLLALLYFPDDQKYAIYIPLFLPIMFPVLLSLKNLLLWLRGKPLTKDKLD